jgi:hypothetical protein
LCFQSVCKNGCNIQFVPLEIFDNLLIFEQFSIAALHYTLDIIFVMEKICQILNQLVLANIDFKNTEYKNRDSKYINNIFEKIVKKTKIEIKNKSRSVKKDTLLNELKKRVFKFGVVKYCFLIKEPFFKQQINSPEFRDVYLSAIDRDYNCLEYINFEILVENLVFSDLQVTNLLYTIISKYPMAIEYIGEKFLTEKLCFLAVKNNPRAIESVKINEKSKLFYDRLCMFAVKKDSSLFNYLDGKYHTEKLCFKIIYKFPDMIQYVSCMHNFYKKLSFLAVKRNGLCLQFVHVLFRTKQLCFTAVYKNPDAILYVPRHYQTSHICIYAIKKKPQCFQYLDNPSNDLSEKIFKTNPSLFLSLTNRCKTHDLCLKMVRENGKFLVYVPSHMQTRKLCQTAIYNNPTSFKYFSNFFKNNDKLVKLALNLDPTNILYLDKQKLLKYLDYVIAKNPGFIRKSIILDGCFATKIHNFVKCEVKESDFAKLSIFTLSEFEHNMKYAKSLCKCLSVLNNDLHKNTKNIITTLNGTRHLQSCHGLKLVSLILDKYPRTFKEIEENFMTHKICLNTLEANGWLLGCIKSGQTLKMCSTAFNNCPKSFQFMRQEFKEKFALEAVRYDGLLLQYCINQTVENCVAAFNQNHYVASIFNKDVKKKLILDSEFLKLFEKYPQSIVHFKECQNLKLCELAVCYKGNTIEVLRYVQNDFKTDNVCFKAAINNPRNLIYMREYQTLQFCEKLVSQKPQAIEFILDKFKTIELCLKTVKQNGLLLKHMYCIFDNTNFVLSKLSEICFCAVSQNSRSILNVPHNFKTNELCLKAIEHDPDIIIHLKVYQTFSLCKTAILLKPELLR